MSNIVQSHQRYTNLSPLALISLDWRNLFVWLMFATSFFVMYEPAPVDILFVVVFVLFFFSGIYISIAVTPLIFFLVLYNFGGYMSLLQAFDDEIARSFIMTSTYMAACGCFYAFYVGFDPMSQMRLIKNALIVAGVLGAVIAMLAYFNLTGGLIRPQYGRATGTFKDPNVISTFLILPACFLIQGFLVMEQRHKFFSFISLIIITAGILMALSRGAVINFVMSSCLIVFLTFIVSPTIKLRSRILVIALIGVGIIALLLMVLLTVEDFRILFFDRLTLTKDYDVGETGRFGNQVNSIPLLLERPLGFGPLQFAAYFHMDPHNTYINAFSSYGWLGGISYVTLLLLTYLVGAKTILTPSPWQNYTIAIYAPFVSTTFQGIQIDTDHWRHLYWMLGFIWGLFAATMAYVPKPAARQV